MKSLICIVMLILASGLLKAEKRTMDVKFNSGKYSLAGRIITAAPEGQRVPAIIFLVGSKGSSYEKGYQSFLRYFFEDNLPLDRVALFYFEKRGVGESEGNWANTDFRERAADAAAAAEFLKTQPFIDPTGIIVAGHSQGGWIAQICAATYPGTFAAGISLAGPSFSVRKQVINDLASRFRCAGVDSLKALRKAESQTGKVFTLSAILPVGRSLRQLRLIRKFDPTEHIRQIRVPFLFLFGENDALVDPVWAQQSLHEIFPQGLPDQFEVRVGKTANHSFRVADFCGTGTSYSEDTRQAIHTWFQRNFDQAN